MSLQTIKLIEISKLFPHPKNPRINYREDVLEQIVLGMSNGFQECYAILVRPLGEGYQVISGHTRLKAAQQAGITEIPCWVKEMTDEEAFFELVLANNQGELSPLEYGMHVLNYVEMCEGGRGKKGGLSEYARVVGKDRTLLSKYQNAAHVSTSIKVCNVAQVLDKANHLNVIHKAPEQLWDWLVEQLVKQEWSVKQTETIVDAIKDVDIPEMLHGFLIPDMWLRKVAADAMSDKPQGLHSKVKLWVESALADYDELPDRAGVWMFDDEGHPYHAVISVQQEFLDRLPSLLNGDKVPSKKKINEISRDLLDWIEDCNDKYEQWLKAQASKEEAERQRREELNRIKAMKAKYAPTGVNADLLSLLLEDVGGELFDAIITDPPYLLSNDGFTLRSGKEASVNKNFEDTEGQAIAPEDWLPHVAEWLKPGGVLIATCTLHIYHRLLSTAQDAGLITDREQAIWLKPNSPPQLSPTMLQPDFEYIFMAFKEGPHYFGSKEYQKAYGDYPSRTFTISQCSGKERLGWHDTQKPLELFEKLVMLYVPEDGRVLDPFAGTGTTAVAAKNLNRVCVWVEKDAEFFAKAEHRIESHKFSWE